MKDLVKGEIDECYYLFKLGKLLKDNKISINKLIRDTNTDFKVIKRLMTGELVRIDIIVLARLCIYFKCTINDIVEYIRY